MDLKVIVTRDFDHMSEVGAEIVTEDIRRKLTGESKYAIGLATGNTPTGIYKHLAKAANSGKFDSSRIQSFNLDEYVGLPGENAQQRALHPESYSFFMIQELFGLLQVKFKETYVPWGTLIEQDRFIQELEANPRDWEMQGADKGKAVVINQEASSKYLRWIRREILNAYEEKIEQNGGIDLHIVGVGGRGHVGFHEAGIPFEENKMLLVKLDDNTVANAVADGHFKSEKKCPLYAVSMGTQLIYQARTVLLMASGGRKTEPVAESLLMEPDCLIPISYGQLASQKGCRVIYLLDRAAAEKVLKEAKAIRERGIEIEDISNGNTTVKVNDLTFFRNPDTCLMS